LIRKNKWFNHQVFNQAEDDETTNKAFSTILIEKVLVLKNLNTKIVSLIKERAHFVSGTQDSDFFQLQRMMIKPAKLEEDSGINAGIISILQKYFTSLNIERL
jgi:glutamyl-tRNA synthetase